MRALRKTGMTSFFKRGHRGPVLRLTDSTEWIFPSQFEIRTVGLGSLESMGCGAPGLAVPVPVYI